MKLYNFFRSGTSHRLRIVLNLKGLDFDYVPVDLRTDQHKELDYKLLHPQGLVPALEYDGKIFIQSPAIIEWLEERYPMPPLLPADPDARAHVRAMAMLIGCDIHPINNRRVLDYLRERFDCDDQAVNAWCAEWICSGFDAFEAMLAADDMRTDFCFGAAPTLADIYLIPQVESARRFKIDLSRWPNILSVDAACHELEAFALAAPSQQPDV